MNPTEGKLTEADFITKLSGKLEEAWVKYFTLFGVVPNGTQKQIAALLELVGRENLESLKAPAVTTGEWRSIESAPKDGTRVDVWAVPQGYMATQLDAERIVNAFCNQNNEQVWSMDHQMSGYQPRAIETEAGGIYKITHWMPLPQPPNSTTLSAPAPLSSEAVGKVREALRELVDLDDGDMPCLYGHEMKFDAGRNALALLNPSPSEKALAHLDSQEQVCPECGGAGSNGINAGVLGNSIKNPCPTCSGTGKAKKGEK